MPHQHICTRATQRYSCNTTVLVQHISTRGALDFVRPACGCGRLRCTPFSRLLDEKQGLSRNTPCFSSSKPLEGEQQHCSGWPGPVTPRAAPPRDGQAPRSEAVAGWRYAATGASAPSTSVAPPPSATFAPPFGVSTPVMSSAMITRPITTR